MDSMQHDHIFKNLPEAYADALNEEQEAIQDSSVCEQILRSREAIRCQQEESEEQQAYFGPVIDPTAICISSALDIVGRSTGSPLYRDLNDETMANRMQMQMINNTNTRPIPLPSPSSSIIARSRTVTTGSNSVLDAAASTLSCLRSKAESLNNASSFQSQSQSRSQSYHEPSHQSQSDLSPHIMWLEKKSLSAYDHHQHQQQAELTSASTTSFEHLLPAFYQSYQEEDEDTAADRVHVGFAWRSRDSKCDEEDDLRLDPLLTMRFAALMGIGEVKSKLEGGMLSWLYLRKSTTPSDSLNPPAAPPSVSADQQPIATNGINELVPDRWVMLSDDNSQRTLSDVSSDDGISENGDSNDQQQVDSLHNEGDGGGATGTAPSVSVFPTLNESTTPTKTTSTPAFTTIATATPNSPFARKVHPLLAEMREKEIQALKVEAARPRSAGYNNLGAPAPAIGR
ncbi:hypothetical protein HDU76_012983 [Blyttiomyces sp. JEL0837]|nr:hypothetical protein HDU76_012983 [Blyttiomyces sp. JEL0837]